MIRRALAALVAATVLSACGGGDGGRFDTQVAGVRDAVEAGDRDAALAELEAIQVLAIGAHEEGQLSDADLEEAVALVAQGRALVDQDLPAPTTTTEATTTTAAPTTTEGPPALAPAEKGDRDDDRGPGRKHGRGERGGDGDDEDDD